MSILGICLIAFLVMLVLKLAGVLSIGWWLVFLPVWGIFGLFLIGVLMVVIMEGFRILAGDSD